ncbi:uncharacterized protein LOC141651829 [Silene latifolia]|uniref:uncharacterized protein LOC141651829 n=1 Tax=Silene latifolia TaxID=37657 RepID=UPI003D770FC8
MGLVWNCRGLNNTLSPTIPKLRALLGSKFYDFVFLLETKCSTSRIFPMFRSLGFVRAFGVDAVGAAGGLWVGWRKESKMSLVKACNNYIILLVEKYNGRLWYLVLFYGAPSVSLRASVFEDLEQWLVTCQLPFLIIGDFNQVGYACDKLSSSQRPIAGAEDFNLWTIRNELVDIPFKGPRFTWCNNRKGDKRVYERLDKALGSKDWLSLFPDTGIKHYPIQISDHAPIEVDLNLINTKGSRPFKLDAWALGFEDCLERVRIAWTAVDSGSPAFRVARKLARVRGSVKKWTLDKKAEWQDKWDEFDRKLEHGINTACKGGGGGDEEYTRVHEEFRIFAAAAAVYWKQRAKVKWTVEGDTCTKFFFNWVKGRAGRNLIHGLKGEDGQWRYDDELVGSEFQ